VGEVLSESFCTTRPSLRSEFPGRPSAYGSLGSSSGYCHSWCRCWWRGPFSILPLHIKNLILRPRAGSTNESKGLKKKDRQMRETRSADPQNISIKAKQHLAQVHAPRETERQLNFFFFLSALHMPSSGPRSSHNSVSPGPAWITWRGVPHLAALGGAGGGREERHVGGAEDRGVQFRRNRGRQHDCLPRVVLAGDLEVPMPRRKGTVRLLATYRLTESWLALDLLGGLPGAFFHSPDSSIFTPPPLIGGDWI